MQTQCVYTVARCVELMAIVRELQSDTQIVGEEMCLTQEENPGRGYLLPVADYAVELDDGLLLLGGEGPALEVRPEVVRPP